MIRNQFQVTKTQLTRLTEKIISWKTCKSLTELHSASVKCIFRGYFRGISISLFDTGSFLFSRKSIILPFNFHIILKKYIFNKSRKRKSILQTESFQDLHFWRHYTNMTFTKLGHTSLTWCLVSLWEEMIVQVEKVGSSFWTMDGELSYS